VEEFAKGPDYRLRCWKVTSLCFDEVVFLAKMLLLWDSLRGFGLSGGGVVVSSLPRSRSRIIVQISLPAQP